MSGLSELRTPHLSITIDALSWAAESTWCSVDDIQIICEQNTMSENLTLELTESQRVMLVQGLHFVRSSRQLAIRDPKPGDDLTRRDELSEVDELAAMLDDLATSPVHTEA